MYVEKLKSLIYENFIDMKNPKSKSLIEFYYIENCEYHDKDHSIVPLSKYSIGEIKSNHYLSKHKDFIISNTIDGSFQEPFIYWWDIPDWYIEDFSFGCLGFISDEKFNFYLPKFMIISLNKECKNNDYYLLEEWYSYLLPFDSTTISMKDRHFNVLSNDQKAVIARLLAYDEDSDSSSIENLLEIADELCRNYWIQYFRQ